MYRFILSTFFSFFFLGFAFSQGHQIDINIDNYDNDTLIIGYYFGDKQLVKDSLFRNDSGNFSFAGTETIDQGIYMALMKPDNSFVQFLVGEEQQFTINADKNNLTAIVFENSKDNNDFAEYVRYIGQKRTQLTDIQSKMTMVDSASNEYLQYEKDIAKINMEVEDNQKSVISDNKGSLTSMILSSGVEVEIPEFEGTPEEVQSKRYYYYKKHYFDNLDLSHPGLVRTSFIHQKVENYFTKLVPMVPDTVIKELDNFFPKLDGNPDAHRYFLSHFINKYAAGKYVGVDKIFVHLINEYVNKGKAGWASEESLVKLRARASELENILIGEVFPNITTFKEDLSPVVLNKLNSPYTLVVFWAPDCGHCKKAMPHIVSFEKEYASKGLKVLSICTKGGEKLNTCWDGLKDKDMGNFINTGDKYQSYRQLVKIPTTPKMFLLDVNKKILIKDIKATELGNVFEKILEEELN